MLYQELFSNDVYNIFNDVKRIAFAEAILSKAQKNECTTLKIQRQTSVEDNEHCGSFTAQKMKMLKSYINKTGISLLMISARI
jgi:hypothetical protein